MDIGKQYGIQYLDGHITAYPSIEAARAAKERMRRWPTTKYVKIIERDYYVGEWADYTEKDDDE